MTYTPARRDEIVRPVSALFTKIGISPTALSVAGVCAMIVCAIALIYQRSSVAILFLLISVIADFLDGSLARYQQSSSATGRIVDIIADNLSFDIFAIALMVSGILPRLPGILLLLVMILATYIHTKKAFARANMHHTPIQDLHGFWIAPNIAKASMYIAFGLFAFSGINFLQITSIILIGILAISIFL